MDGHTTTTCYKLHGYLPTIAADHCDHCHRDGHTIAPLSLIGSQPKGFHTIVQPTSSPSTMGHNPLFIYVAQYTQILALLYQGTTFSTVASSSTEWVLDSSVNEHICFTSLSSLALTSHPISDQFLIALILLSLTLGTNVFPLLFVLLMFSMFSLLNLICFPFPASPNLYSVR
ncbi:hypothetical protein NE237_007336 [Protea cynaroides]|uniref:Uncharacterized protein n=1 Tax=Protea cynaroides TaxID=273540 RepID=A0A9Q0KP74_9MAGN|nr:hypothetical protein NE237_007336 [Protea cynaroides]